MKNLLLLMVLTLVFATGCQFENETKEEEKTSQALPLSSTDGAMNQTPSNQAEKIMVRKNHLKDIKAVNNEKKLLIAVQIPHNDRFQIKDIEKKLKEEAKKQFSGHKVTLSLDQKINLEVKELKQRIAKGEISKKKLTKEIDRIIKLSKRKP
ncbi:hypothetical protein [Halobacillus mangrovi]|uniref:hypothetical protein n=1 Tax=Halobacillus mangrovi TaxID=402384 RepID=UPI003D9529A3